MRPLRLIIKGFGTYLEEQDLDFTCLQDRNIFVITGDTGAGKTTIFDAINYALYGDASGREREGISFRSDFATPEEDSKVELWFSLGNKVYYVKREPAYMEKKTRGEGEKEHKAYAELKLPQGKVITGIKPVTLEVVKILGINQDQFRQIVMIPQGEFKKLLSANSQDREMIFRKIFGTEVFEAIQVKMNNRANELDKDVRLKRHERDTKLRDFDCKDTDEEVFRMLQSENLNPEEIFKRAKELIKEDIKLKTVKDQEVKAAEEVIETLHKALVQGENVNKKFEDYKVCEESLRGLLEETEVYKEKRIALSKGRKALTVKGFEEKWVAKNLTYKQQDEALKETLTQHSLLKESYDKAVKDLEQEKGKESQIKALEAAVHEAEKLKVKAEKYEISKENANKLQKEADTLKRILGELEEAVGKGEKSLQTLEEQAEKIIQAEKEKIQLDNNLKELKVQKEELAKLKDFIKEAINKKEAHEILKTKFNTLHQNYERDKIKYEALEESFRRGQAGILAQTLKEDKPCPVCGSCTHPAPAVLTDETINEEAVDQAKAVYEATRAKREDCLGKLTELNTRKNLLEKEHILPLVKKLLMEEVTPLDEIQAKVALLLNEKDVLLNEKISEYKGLERVVSTKEQLAASKTVLNKKLLLDRENFKRQTELFLAKQGELSAAKEQLKLIEEEFEGKVRTYQELLKEITKYQEKLETLNKAYKLAEENHNKLFRTLGEIEGKLISIKSNLELVSQERDEAAQLFKEKTLALGFVDGREYKAFAMTEDEIEALDKAIRHFEVRLEGAKKLYEKAKEEVKDLNLVDLSLIKEKLNLKNLEKAQLVKEQQSLFARVQSNQKVIKEAEGVHGKIKVKEEKYKLVGELAKVMKGDNPHRISFERYVLAAYFDDIIEASNVRFSKMTGGRFELLRKTGKGDARSHQGLELEVMDNYTGKARSIDTLSGGESFKASLAMALGLADVVQSHAGGIQLDTMFVDEGFGTLDPESLESAINCLIGLQSNGRLVGIISHVPELKERIDARLEVKRITRGSRAVFKV